MSVEDLKLEGRPDEEPLTPEELAGLATVADAFTEVVAEMRLVKTVGDARRLEATVDRLDREVMG